MLISLRHEHVVAVLAAVGDDDGNLVIRAHLADADDGVEALVSVLLDDLGVGHVLAVGGLKRQSFSEIILCLCQTFSGITSKWDQNLQQ